MTPTAGGDTRAIIPRYPVSGPASILHGMLKLLPLPPPEPIML